MRNKKEDMLSNKKVVSIIKDGPFVNHMMSDGTIIAVCNTNCYQSPFMCYAFDLRDQKEAAFYYACFSENSFQPQVSKAYFGHNTQGDYSTMHRHHILADFRYLPEAASQILGMADRRIKTRVVAKEKIEEGNYKFQHLGRNEHYSYSKTKRTKLKQVKVDDSLSAVTYGGYAKEGIPYSIGHSLLAKAIILVKDESALKRMPMCLQEAVNDYHKAKANYNKISFYQRAAEDEKFVIEKAKSFMLMIEDNENSFDTHLREHNMRSFSPEDDLIKSMDEVIEDAVINLVDHEGVQMYKHDEIELGYFDHNVPNMVLHKGCDKFLFHLSHHCASFNAQEIETFMHNASIPIITNDEECAFWIHQVLKPKDYGNCEVKDFINKDFLADLPISKGNERFTIAYLDEHYETHEVAANQPRFKGFCDRIVFVNGHLVFLEVKNPLSNKVSSAVHQLQMMLKLKHKGELNVHYAYGFEHALSILKEYEDKPKGAYKSLTGGLRMEHGNALVLEDYHQTEGLPQTGLDVLFENILDDMEA